MTVRPLGSRHVSSSPEVKRPERATAALLVQGFSRGFHVRFPRKDYRAKTRRRFKKKKWLPRAVDKDEPPRRRWRWARRPAPGGRAFSRPVVDGEPSQPDDTGHGEGEN